jgi:hypothetical protein
MGRGSLGVWGGCREKCGRDGLGLGNDTTALCLRGKFTLSFITVPLTFSVLLEGVLNRHLL